MDRRRKSKGEKDMRRSPVKKRDDCVNERGRSALGFEDSWLLRLMNGRGERDCCVV